MHGSTHKFKYRKNTTSNELQYCKSDEGEKYAFINCDKGNARFDITLYTTNEISLAKARGAIIRGPKKQKLARGDLVLVQSDSSTTFTDKYYIIHKYSPDEVKRLRKAGELTKIKETSEENTVTIAFEDDVIVDKQDEIDMNDEFIAGI